MAFIPATNRTQRGIDSTNRGPARWERAARNALRNPHSDAAAVFRDRTTLALLVSDARRAMGDADEAWTFNGARGAWDADAHRFVTKRTRLYSTCSTYCTVLQITLDFGARDFLGVARAFAAKPNPQHPWMRTVEKLDPKTLKRQVRCQVCTRKIGRKAS